MTAAAYERFDWGEEYLAWQLELIAGCFQNWALVFLESHVIATRVLPGASRILPADLDYGSD